MHPEHNSNSSSKIVVDNRIYNPIVLVAVLILGVLAFQLCASMVTPALPTMAKEIGTDEAGISQVSSLFFLSSAVSGLFLSRWADFIGRKRAFMIVMALLAAGTVIALLATNLTMLLIGRVFQGFSGAAFQLAYVTLNTTMTPKMFATSLGFITAINGGIGGLDGWIGGMLSDNFGYTSIFLIILALTAIAWIGIIAYVPNTKADDGGSMDWAGATMLGLCLICTTYFLSEGPRSGWLGTSTILLAVGALMSFVAFTFVEKKSPSPMFPLHALRSRQVWPVVATTFLTLSSIFAVINFVLVLYSQNPDVGFGFDAGKASLLYLTPPALIGLAAAPISGWLAGKFGWVRIAQYGLLLAIAALVVIVLFLSSPWVVFAMVCVLGVAYNGLILTTVNGLGVVQSPDNAPGALPGINSAAFGIGASTGITIVAPMVVGGSQAGFTQALWVLIIISGLALVSASLIKPAYGQR
ncbi:MFS transporter [Trueperella pyogenes]|uniref:MFS transporter n=1 Tax=Trueperella pyogenes TaxID=1661 RepID=UPI000D255E30|nr:MFS transporter [Trueperella pyogenes]AWA43071.1 MFS transporter [Trueperella pyogenes]